MKDFLDFMRKAIIFCNVVGFSLQQQKGRRQPKRIMDGSGAISDLSNYEMTSMRPPSFTSIFPLRTDTPSRFHRPPFDTETAVG